MTQKECPACGASFGCSADSGGCWCEQTKLTSEILAALRARYADCLCPRCLAAAAEGEAQAESAAVRNASLPGPCFQRGRAVG